MLSADKYYRKDSIMTQLGLFGDEMVDIQVVKPTVEFKKLYEDSVLPSKAHESDAGFDLYVHSFAGCMNGKVTPWDVDLCVLNPGVRVLAKCGFGMALPEGFEAQIRPRSGLALKHGISVVNSPGTIDAGWRSEVGVILINTGNQSFEILKGNRIAQMVIKRVPEIVVLEVDELTPASERGQAGFGSSGI